MTNINKVMNLAIYHPSERIRKKNEARFFRDILNIKDDLELGKTAYSFFSKKDMIIRIMIFILSFLNIVLDLVIIFINNVSLIYSYQIAKNLGY